MNPLLRGLFARRSVRKFTDQPVTDEQVRDLLEAAMAAPSAVARDPWQFVVIRHPDTLRRIANGLTNGRHLAHAAVGIAVCGDLKRAHDGQLSYLLQDCAAAMENLLVAAGLLGIGASWCGVHPVRERITRVRNTLGLPASVIPVAIAAVGWPAQRMEPRTRYRDAAVHLERW